MFDLDVRIRAFYLYSVITLFHICRYIREKKLPVE